MSSFQLFQVDAFANGLFTGNPAAVVLLGDSWLPAGVMQQIALENNLAETAFVMQTGEQWYIRWFTPAIEVDLCGHATLASAHVLFSHTGVPGDRISFFSRSGELFVTRKGDLLTLDFPSDIPTPSDITSDLEDCFNIRPIEAWRGKTDYMLVFANEAQVADMIPDMAAIGRLDARGVIITAPGQSVDFVSRFFGPQSGVPEDPVTGSAHTTLTPYWSKRLGRSGLTAMQLSARKGWLSCLDRGARIEISGKAVTFLTGECFV